MDPSKIKQLSKEMAAFSRQTAQKVKKPSGEVVTQILSIVLVALATVSPNKRTNGWD